MASCTSRERRDALSLAAPLRSAFGELFRVARQPCWLVRTPPPLFGFILCLLAACKTLASTACARMLLLLSLGRQLVA